MANRDDRSDKPPIVLCRPMTVVSLFTFQKLCQWPIFLFYLPLNDIPSRFKLIFIGYFLCWREWYMHVTISSKCHSTDHVDSILQKCSIFYTPLFANHRRYLILQKPLNLSLVHVWSFAGTLKVPSSFSNKMLSKGNIECCKSWVYVEGRHTDICWARLIYKRVSSKK